MIGLIVSIATFYCPFDTIEKNKEFQIFVTYFYKTKMTVEVYGDISSAPTRLVLMTCECLELDYNFNTVSLLNGEHKLPEYTKVKVFP